MEGSDGRTRQRVRTLRILSRIKTLRSSDEAMVLEAGAANPERKLMSEAARGEFHAEEQRREGTAQSVATSVVMLDGDRFWRRRGEQTGKWPERKQRRVFREPNSKKRCLQRSSIFRSETGYGCGGGKTFGG